MINYAFEQIHKIVNETYHMVCNIDKDLLFIGANERSITHRMAVYLEPYFPGWNVDCEYNRLNEVPKRLHSFGENPSQNGQTVFPDIIVHKRRTPNNLLVIEAKTSENFVPHIDGICLCDMCKLNAYVLELDYHFAYSLLFPVNNDVIENGVTCIYPETRIAVVSPVAQ